jgi:thiamine pyrophosphokinase
MTWADFLKNIADQDQVSLVGPLLNRAHHPVMPTIYVDGGSNFRKDGGWGTQEPAADAFFLVSVGDGDSASGKLDEVLPAHKNYSDLAFVLRSLPESVVRVEMLGFLGGRRDHELANLGELHQFLRSRHMKTTVHVHGSGRGGGGGGGGESIVAFSHGKLNFEICGLFSVMVFEAEAVRISGACEYKLAGDVVLPVASSVGLSNVGNGIVTVETVKPCFVFLPA